MAQSTKGSSWTNIRNVAVNVGGTWTNVASAANVTWTHTGYHLMDRLPGFGNGLPISLSPIKMYFEGMGWVIGFPDGMEFAGGFVGIGKARINVLFVSQSSEIPYINLNRIIEYPGKNDLDTLVQLTMPEFMERYVSRPFVPIIEQSDRWLTFEEPGYIYDVLHHQYQGETTIGLVLDGTLVMSAKNEPFDVHRTRSTETYGP